MSDEYIPAKDFTPIPDLNKMHAYRWNDRVIDHLFCKTCGIYPYHGNDKYGYRITLGCVEDINPLELEMRIIDGKAMPLNENPGNHP